MTQNDWPSTAKELSAELRNLRGGASEVMKAFSAIAQAALAPTCPRTRTTGLSRPRSYRSARSST